MIIQSTRVWYRERFQPLQIEISGGEIVDILEYGEVHGDEDYGDLRIIPGMIDIHNHGYGGLDCNHATKEWLRQWVRYLPSEGVTGILATTSTVPESLILEGMHNIASVMKEAPKGARILGVYSEGPLISSEFRGAQDINNIVKPAIEIIDKYQEASGGNLLYCCIAPEADDNMEVIKYCTSKGIRVAIGHSGATFSQCTLARSAGAKSFAHTFNGMRGLHHREAGVVGAAMYYDDMYAEVIGDGIHVDFNVVNILGKIKGKDKLILVSDSVQIKGLPPGEYRMPGRHVFLGEDGVGRLENGTIAGGTGKMNLLLRNLIEKARLDEATAINAATCNPLRMLGLDKSKGYIEKGYNADLTILADDYSVCQTFVLGEKML